MMTFLVTDLIADHTLFGLADRERAIPALPCEFRLVIPVDPFRRNRFKFSEKVGDRSCGEKPNEQVNVV